MWFVQGCLTSEPAEVAILIQLSAFAEAAQGEESWLSAQAPHQKLSCQPYFLNLLCFLIGHVPYCCFSGVRGSWPLFRTVARSHYSVHGLFPLANCRTIPCRLYSIRRQNNPYGSFPKSCGPPTIRLVPCLIPCLTNSEEQRPQRNPNFFWYNPHQPTAPFGFYQPRSPII